MTELDFGRLRGIVADQAYPLAFSTVSGAHLYGFPSVDSDVDLRGAHTLPASEVVGLRVGPQTLTHAWVTDGVEIDLVTHDLGKFCRLLLQRNGYVAEQLLSPLVVTTSDIQREMIALAPHCLTRFHAFHYLGFALLADVIALSDALNEAHQSSKLPERATAEAALHDLLIRTRL